MALITWNDGYSVKVKQFDDQHKVLIKMINDLHDAMKERKTKETLEKIVEGLLDYTGTHFSAEEKEFDRLGYPETAAHKLEHKNFVDKVSQFGKDFDSGKVMLSIDIINFLRDWLIKHINGTDKKYSEFLNSKGVV